MDQALIALCALFLNAALGGPRRMYDNLGVTRITRFPIKVLRDIERKLNREQRSVEERETRGFILVCVVIGSSFMLGWVLHTIFGPQIWFVELALLTCVLSARASWDIASGIKKALQTHNIAVAKTFLEGTVWRHHLLLDELALTRAAIEVLAVQLSEKILSITFWYLLLGLPGIFIVLCVNMMRDHMTQSVSEQGFGRAIWAVHRWLHYVPARIAGILWMIVSLFLGAKRWQELSQAFFTALAIKSPRNFSLTIAGKVIGVTLGGPGSVYETAWVGGGGKATTADIQKALYLFGLLHVLVFILLGMLLL